MVGPAFPLLDCQKALVKDPSKFILAMASRQTGKTSTVGLKVVDQIHEKMVVGDSKFWVILSSGERLSREVMSETIRKHSYAYQLGASDIQEGVFKGTEGNHTQLEVKYPGGSRILALPANPDTARGYTTNLWLDEFATHQQSREIWGAAFPLISAGHDIIVSTTPKGKSNKWYELWTATRGTWSRHSWDVYQAVAQGLPRNIQELRDNLGDDELWAQEFELKFTDEATAWLSWDLINSCEHTLAGIPSGYLGGECVVGVDIASGRGRDLFVIQVLERIGDVWWHREEIAEANANFSVQDDLLDGVMKRYRVTSCYMDQTGIGEKPVHDAQRNYGQSVLGVLASPASKLRQANAAKRAFEDRKVRIATGSDELRNDLHKIKKEVVGDKLRFTAERDKSGHADRASALLLALDAARSCGIGVYAYQPFPSRNDTESKTNSSLFTRLRSFLS